MDRAQVARAIGLVCTLMGALVLSGCAETALTANTAKSLNDALSDPWQGGHYKVGSAYQVSGRWYTPHEDFEYDEVGVASWYGPNFHGGRTANGERFDQNGLSAAHRTLPLPSLVRVTNLENGRAVTLRVNDRGPFANDRILDVSKKAAELLGFRNKGTARVRVVILPEESLALRAGLEPSFSRATTVRLASAVPAQAPMLMPPTMPPNRAAVMPALVAGTRGWFVQAGAFSDAENAQRVASDLAGIGPTRVSAVVRNGRDLVRVRLGPVTEGRDAARLLQRVQASGYPDARLVAN
ncbi:septal ring lytic transglycosylase RlpA family protein [Roseospira marina]|uniref:Endolytic peptidoglycan transglycosylase RlpA n=1 Tax=Roseospira marina TaxID=140057 RepID=A0A5M6IH60_9PROT|nr:septal ring lytic transglycosylase RlpA family protein [Roseospira marina]KAA5607247.1 septal ring lytic transglycosylase RlpA family protein [Roseospira marina]MBB4312601.1 rare lipoprotein A [Roseospira marina]MBB5085383.1 rare lipoprotein A [Roseospira marina]